MFGTARGSISNGKIQRQFDQLDAEAQQKAVPKLFPSLCEGKCCCSCLLAGLEGTAGPCAWSDENVSNVWFDKLWGAIGFGVVWLGFTRPLITV